MNSSQYQLALKDHISISVVWMNINIMIHRAIITLEFHMQGLSSSKLLSMKEVGVKESSPINIGETLICNKSVLQNNGVYLSMMKVNIWWKSIFLRYLSMNALLCTVHKNSQLLQMGTRSRLCVCIDLWLTLLPVQYTRSYIYRGDRFLIHFHVVILSFLLTCLPSRTLKHQMLVAVWNPQR